MYSPASFIAVAVVLPLLGVVAVGVRFYVRLCLRSSRLGADDYMIVIGCLLVCAMCVNQLVGTIDGGLGRHTPTAQDGSPVIDDRTRTLLKNIYAQDIIEKLAYGSIKLSVLLFYRRIFCTPRFLKTNDIVIALTAMWTVSFFVVEIFICALHPAILWTYKNAQEKKAQCADSSMVLLWFAITDVLGDIVILSMPFRPIQILQKSKKEKLGIFAIFMLGALSTAAGIVRLGFVVRAFTQAYGESGDIDGASSPPWLWTTIEASVGVLAACLPAMAPLIRTAPNPSRISYNLKSRISSYYVGSKHSQPLSSPSSGRVLSPTPLTASSNYSRSGDRSNHSGAAPNENLQSLPSIARSLSNSGARRDWGTVSWAEEVPAPRQAPVSWGLFPKAARSTSPRHDMAHLCSPVSPYGPDAQRSPASPYGTRSWSRRLSVVNGAPVEHGKQGERQGAREHQRERKLSVVNEAPLEHRNDIERNGRREPQREQRRERRGAVCAGRATSVPRPASPDHHEKSIHNDGRSFFSDADSA